MASSSACCVRLLRWGKETDLGIHKGYFDFIISADWLVVKLWRHYSVLQHIVHICHVAVVNVFVFS